MTDWRKLFCWYMFIINVVRSGSERTILHCVESYLYYIILVNKNIYFLSSETKEKINRQYAYIVENGYVPLILSTSRSFPRSWIITGFVPRSTRSVPLVEQKLLTISEHQRSPSVFIGVLVTRSLVLCVYFVYRCLFFGPFSFGHCVVYSSMINGFWLPLWIYFLNKIPLTLGCLWNISYFYICIVALFFNIYIYIYI